MFNPWATTKVAKVETPETPLSEEQQYAERQVNSFSVPSLESGSAYNDSYGWAASDLVPSTTGYPSAQRLMSIPRFDRYPSPESPPEDYYHKIGNENIVRHSNTESVVATPWQTPSGVEPTDRRWVDSPMRTPPAETRLTSRMSPRGYSFQRPYGQDVPRSLNGNHFSMADHRRTYEVGGQIPVTSRRNTYRLEPVPWDIDIVDTVSAENPAYYATIGNQLPPTNRSYRLT